MLRWNELATTTVPGGGTLRLMQRGTEFSIMAGSIALMSSRLRGSEEALANLTCERLRHKPGAKILIGGLGMGFTLRAAQLVLGKDARIVVAELVPAVIAWGRGPLAPLYGSSLDDPRITIHEGDVGAVIASNIAAFDAILLDVDNGPDGLTRQSNDGLYGLAGLSAARAALRPAGVLAVWSSGPDAAFSKRLGMSGFSVEQVGVRAHGTKGIKHVIWLGTRSAGRAAPR